MESASEKYLREHSSPQSEALEWIEKQTNIRTNYPRMLSGAVQGRLLTILAEISNARKVLEIGTFTGYSATCLAYGLPEEGHIDTLEINDELEDLIREGWSRAGVEGKITLHIVFDLVRPGGLILADDVLWDGKLWQDPLPQDKQTLGIAAFNDKVMADPRVESVLLPIRDGLNVIRKK